MAENPFGSLLNPNAARAGLWDMRMMSAANRSESPFERGMRSNYGRQGMSGDPMISGLANTVNEPDYSQFTYNPQLNAQARSAGVVPLEANQVKQNVLFPNTGFFGNHPRLSGAIEGGIFGALASHGGETPGESIQGALEGIVGSKRIREGLYRQQFARPFESAGALEQLNDMGEQRQLRQAQIKHYQDESDIQHDRIQQQKQNELDKINATRPVPDATGTWVYGQGQPGGSFNGIPFEGRQGGWQHMAEGGRQTASHDLDQGTREQLKIMGVDPKTATPGQIGQANTASQHQAIQRGSAIAGGGANARIPAQNYTDARKVHDQRMEDYNKKILKSDDPASASNARQAIIMQRMSDNRNDILPSDKDIKDYINQNNQAVQQTIQSETDQFNQKWPQAMEAPPAPKGSSPKTGLAPKGKIPTYNPNTGRLE